MATYSTFTQPGGQAVDLTQNPWMPAGPNNPNPYTPPQPGQFVPSNPFSPTSTYSDLVAQLNQANAAPGSTPFDTLTDEYNTTLGLTGQGPGNGYDWGQYDPSRTKIYEPGADLRYINDVNGQQVAGWQAHPDTPSGGDGTMGPFSPITPTSGWSPDPRTNDLYNMLNTEATQNPIPSPNDPVIKAQTNAYNAQATRDMRNYVNELAERGGPNANLGAQGMQAAEQVAQGAGQFQGTLMQNELNARRQQIQDALTGMGNLLSDQQRMQLQNQLAIMDNLLGQASLEQGAYQFDTTNANNTSPLAL